MALGRTFGFLEETLHDAVQLWDRVLDLKPAIAEGDWGTVAAAVLLIAAQQGVWRALPQSPAPALWHYLSWPTGCVGALDEVSLG